MQLISVERWTFWTAVVLAGVSPILNTIYEATYGSGGTGEGILGLTGGAVLLLLLVSVGFGGSRDPSVRSVFSQPEA